ncbi:uncharacterized protein PV07_04375 [Cladophialophora immunda]|uniref:Guided entry of tail-anchored proteins 1 n=1 Tax=Cladophialophora immunda TaxID=569365 RepID=A0A0D2CSA2_9EURO|nr:uncharacterized protein PV07_04375 [Cladophialophora immunda]KIW32860.1 hypothetical protein PV07_04375 [Cladophialophora immunda]
MVSLLVTVFLIQLVCHLVLTIGSKPINDLLWQIYCRLPLQSSTDIQEQMRLRREVLRLKREMNAVSAQDEFSKWAKLRRQHDKAMDEHDKKGELFIYPLSHQEARGCNREEVEKGKREKECFVLVTWISTFHATLCWQGRNGGKRQKSKHHCILFSLRHSPQLTDDIYLCLAAAAVSSSRASFDTKATAIRWTCTSGLRLALQFWHAKTPVFTYPRGWFPWYIEWLLGFPRCPYGGVSINVWSTACATVIALVWDVMVYLIQSVQQQVRGGQQQGKEKVDGRRKQEVRT